MVLCDYIILRLYLSFITVNPFMPNVYSHPYQLDESISNFRVVGWYFSFLFEFQKMLMQANMGEPD